MNRDLVVPIVLCLLLALALLKAWRDDRKTRNGQRNDLPRTRADRS